MTFKGEKTLRREQGLCLLRTSVRRSQSKKLQALYNNSHDIPDSSARNRYLNADVASRRAKAFDAAFFNTNFG
jgi:hypothetical protein